jgi:hypothetical protein
VFVVPKNKQLPTLTENNKPQLQKPGFWLKGRFATTLLLMPELPHQRRVEIQAIWM